MGERDDTETFAGGVRPGRGRLATPASGISARYQLGETIGAGGMGEVVAARDDQLDREVAIKRMQDEAPGEQQLRRFLREARIQGRLEHPAVVPVHELGRDRHGLPYFVMKKLEGRTLKTVLAEDAAAQPSRRRLLRAFVDVCLAIEYAHVQGVIHRDLKPDNIMVGDYGEVYVIDWGVAKVTDEPDEAFTDLGREGATLAGVVIGTRGYMSPEQEAGEIDVDARSDVFALGRVLAAILVRYPAPSPELDALCERATAQDRDRRIASARELADGVQRYLDGDRDLVLRGKLATEHLAAARSAHARADVASAMREAGRALALEPRLIEAAELVSRLTLEPPHELPIEVAHALAAEDVQTVRVAARGAARAQIGWLATAPFVVAAGNPWQGALLGASILFSIMSAWRNRRGTALPTLKVGVTMIVPLALTSLWFTPLISGAVAGVVALSVTRNPTVSARSSCVFGAFLLVGVFAPALFWIVGIAAPQVTLDGGHVWMAAHAIGASDTTLTVGLLVTAAIAVPIAVFMGHFMRRHTVMLRRAAHLQGWQLAQLAPDTLGIRVAR